METYSRVPNSVNYIGKSSLKWTEKNVLEKRRWKITVKNSIWLKFRSRAENAWRRGLRYLTGISTITHHWQSS